MQILLATFGSLGDLHPFIGLGQALAVRQHDVTIATTEEYEHNVTGAGLNFRAVRPSWDPEMVDGLGQVARLRESYHDLAVAAAVSAVMVTGVTVHAASMVAESVGIPWISAVLQPQSMLSAFDPPWPLRRPDGDLRMLARNRSLLRQWKLGAAPLSRVAGELRRELGLSPGRNMLDDYSPWVVLALFSPVLGPPQPDWPPHTVPAGFVFYDGSNGGTGVPARVREFIESGPPPLVFTLGTHGATDSVHFFTESVTAAKRLNARAVLIGAPFDEGSAIWERAEFDGEDIVADNYIPYAEIFPSAAAVIHHGGVGTTAAAMAAGRPMLMVPRGDDHPDNASRAAALGIARILPAEDYTGPRAAAELVALLNDPGIAVGAAEIGRLIRAERGVETACAAIEAV